MSRILIVDDDAPTVSGMAKLLEQDGHEVAAFTSAHDAVAALRSLRPFDAVVTDFEMPKVSGAVVAKVARECSPNACVLVTNRGRADAGRLHAAGACAVLEKPIQYDHIHKLIGLCRGQGGHAGAACARHALASPRSERVR